MVYAQKDYFVYFEYNKDEVPDSAMAYLIKTIYSENVTDIYLEGHCDSIGSRSYNYNLSMRRVKAVERLLVDNGFDSRNVKGKVGFGKDKPLVQNSTETARQKNRRVLVRFGIAKEKQVIRPPRNMIYGKKKEVEKPKVRTVEVKKITTPIKKRTHLLMRQPIKKKRKIIRYQKPAPRPKQLKVENFKPNNTIALPNLLFQGGRHFLINRSTPSLDTLISILKEKTNVRIEIQGHVCCTTYQADGYDWDTRTDNLSVNRSIAIKEYLVKNGISSTRIRTRGFGGSRKLFPLEENEYQRQQNRRVEVMVLPD